ncbi:LOG family protein [Mucilaginibacter sp. HMF5004]|uniref:LOG family protein n=1 Tax=Mucilaginibacter rivuli TaxID=2857527 RepID=UPI001C607039|nr:LOG family protein [Mucilaginibacter rivuli]MBW4888925.1 LOG family protein [Mucilaginibacter rivuli]
MMTRKNKHTTPDSLSHFLMGPGKIWDNLAFCFKAMLNFLKALRALHFCGPCVCVVGSAGYQQDANHNDKYAEGIGAIIANMGLTTITSNGSGLMAAVNKGAYNAGGYSISCNIQDTHQQPHNPYLHLEVNIPYFFVRKTLLIKYSYACIVMPGSLDTLDELFEVLSLIKAAKLQPFPVIVFGKEFYTPIRKQIEAMHTAGTLEISEPSHLFFTDSPDEVEYILQEYVVKSIKLKKI